MFSLKIRLLLALFTFSTGVLLVRVCLIPSPEKPLEIPIQKSVLDSRFEEAEFDKNLQAQTDALLPFFDRMPPVAIYIKDEPILQSGTNTETGNAYTNCDRNEFPFIFIKKIYYQNAHQTKLTNTLKHELTHAWLCRQHLMSVGHNDIFRRKLKQAGGWLNSSKRD